MMFSRGTYCLSVCMAMALCMFSCDVKDDLLLPLVKSEITSFLIAGQCGEDGETYAAAQIDKDNCTVVAYVDDRTPINSVEVRSVRVSNDATIGVMTEDGVKELDSFAPSYDAYPVLDFSSPRTFVLTTYQEYKWQVTVQQIVKREVVVEGQVGTAVIDTVNHNVLVYVSSSQNLSSVKVEKFTLGGTHGTVSPDPTGTVQDFSMRRKFSVKEYCSKTATDWYVYLYKVDESQSVTATVFPYAVSASVSGHMQSGVTPTVEYRKSGAQDWTTLEESLVECSDVSYTANLKPLEPGTTYECRVKANTNTSSIQEFTTAEALQIENGSFDYWHVEGSGKQALYCPWSEGGSSYWDTGNRGATTVGASNSTYGTDGSRTYANLQSKFIVIKFAAGNIFTGSYIKTDGTNGILSFGRPFNSFPTGVRFDYKYKTSTINRGGDKWDDNYSKYISRTTYDGLRGKPDSCQIYVALIGDKSEQTYEGETYPLVIKTRPSELQLFSPTDDNVIAYAQMTKGESVTEWTTQTLTLNYRHTDRTPKYIIVVASSSKYGDYFIGGDESQLQVDDIRLLYE